jgi:hypothetical protein
MSEIDEKRDELILWWAASLQRIADENPDSYGATLLTVDGGELPCLCRREPGDPGWYLVVAPTSWGPLFETSDDTKVKSVRHPDGVLDFWCHRSAMSPLRNWLAERLDSGS